VDEWGGGGGCTRGGYSRGRVCAFKILNGVLAGGMPPGGCGKGKEGGGSRSIWGRGCLIFKWYVLVCLQTRPHTHTKPGRGKLQWFGKLRQRKSLKSAGKIHARAHHPPLNKKKKQKKGKKKGCLGKKKENATRGAVDLTGAVIVSWWGAHRKKKN